jgi:transcriptional regulator MraZ
MFSGEQYTSIDAKGRTSMPAKMREVFSEIIADERFVITKCPVDMGNGIMGRGLAVYPYKDWQEMRDKINNGGSGFTAAQLNSIKRLILAPGVDCTADKQGRMLIPPTLRSYASLEREIVFVGTGNKIEIWNQQAWDNVCSQSEQDFPLGTQALAELGL